MIGDVDDIGMDEDLKEEEPEDLRQKLVDENYQLDNYKRLLQIINER